MTLVIGGVRWTSRRVSVSPRASSLGRMDEPPRFRQSSRKFARAQRQNMTRAETMLWRAMRNHQIDGHGFRGQTPIGPYLRISFVLHEKSSLKRTAARMRRRKRGSRTPKGMNGFDARDFTFFDFPTSSSSADCRSSSSAFVRHCVRRDLASPFPRRYRIDTSFKANAPFSTKWGRWPERRMGCGKQGWLEASLL